MTTRVGTFPRDITSAGRIDYPTQQWRVTTTARTRERFEEGPAAVVALARSSERADATDAHQWLVNVMLVRE